MTTVINNPPTTPATSSDTGGNNGMGFLIGTIILVAFFAILLYFGLPYLKNMSSPQINIPAGNSTTLDSKEKCLQDGGVWQNWGLFPDEYCQIPSADGGKICTDGSQCSLNSCITYSDSSAGQCRTYQDTFGCYSELVDGKMSPELCFA